jgi:predicted CoA-binding protein
MNTRATIDDFLSDPSIAIVGISRNAGKFGNIACKQLQAVGYHMYPVHPNMDQFNGRHCFPNLGALPGKIDRLLLVVPSRETEKLVREAATLGISRIWMQQGAESDKAIRFCEENNMSVVYGECILMFTREGNFFHRLHRWVRSLLGKLPD